MKFEKHLSIRPKQLSLKRVRFLAHVMILKVWWPITLQPLELQWLTESLWKFLIFFYLVIAVVLSSYVFLSIIPYFALLVLTYSIGYVSFLSWLYAGCGHHYYFILQCGMMMEMNSYFFPFSFLVHPSCMDYSEKLIKKIVQLSTWQCTNCKTCQECHEANDDVSAGMGRAYMIFKSRCHSFHEIWQNFSDGHYFIIN